MRAALPALAAMTWVLLPAAAPAQTSARRTFALRLEAGAFAPAGIGALTASGNLGERLQIEGSVGRGAESWFGSAGIRWLMVPSDTGGGLGLAVGNAIGGGGKCYRGPVASFGDWGWIEFAWNRRGESGFDLLLGLGAEVLLAGGYHVDGGDINLLDATPGTVLPFLRIGLGYAF